MPARSRFKITQFRNPSGGVAWRVTGTKSDGKRVRSNFPTRDLAIGEMQRLEIESCNITTATRLQHTRLDIDQIREAEKAYDLLDGWPLLDAVRFWKHLLRD